MDGHCRLYQKIRYAESIVFDDRGCGYMPEVTIH